LSKKNFDKLLLGAVDEGLSTLGESSKQAIYFHLDKNFNIKREEIPERPEAFVQAIENIFGLGASCLEVLIMQRLYEKIGGVFEWQESKGFSFTEYVAAVKQSLQEKNKTKTTTELIECEKVEMKV